MQCIRVVKAGEVFGVHEYILNIRMQFTAKGRSKEGSYIIQMPKSLLDARLKSDPKVLYLVLLVMPCRCMFADVSVTGCSSIFPTYS